MHVCVCVFVCVSSPARWRVWTTPGCRPGSQCLCSAAPDPSACSRSAGIGQRCRRLTPAGRAGGETRRWPSLLPGGRCTAALGEGWSCSTPAAGREKTREGIRKLEYFLTVRGYPDYRPRIKNSNKSILHSLTLLSLPPDARCWWSGDHLSPHTSCL